MTRRSFNGFSGTGLGIRESSLTQLPNVDPSHPLGQAKINTSFNVLSGNVFIADHLKPIEDLGFQFNVGMVYNSGAHSTDELWRLNLTQKISSVSGGAGKPGSEITLTEEDGSEIIFKFDEQKNQYIAIGKVNGKHILTGEADGTWTCCCPATGLTTTFTAAGMQTKLIDRQRRQCTFHYNESGQLDELSLPSGAILSISRDNHQTKLSYKPQDEVSKDLITYQFDSSGRLDTTTVPLDDNNHYLIQYAYEGDSNRVQSVQQSDGSALHFSYASIDGAYFLKTLQEGEGNPYTIDYEVDKTTLTDPLGCATHYVTQQSLLMQLIRPFDQAHSDTLTFDYDEHKQLKTTNYSSGVDER